MKVRIFLVSVFCVTLWSCGSFRGERLRTAEDIDKLVKRMTAVSGGDSVIASIETQVSQYTADGANFVITFKRPNKIRFDFFDLNDTLVFTTATNGKEAWAFLPDSSVVPLHGRKTAELIGLAEHWIDEWRLYKTIGLTIRHVGNSKLSRDRQCYKMSVKDRFGIEGFYYVNRQTFLMARIDYPTIDAFSGKVGGLSIHDFQEYHNIGVVFPTKELENGKKIIEMKKWTNNPYLDDSVFELDKVNVVTTGARLERIAVDGSPVQ